MLALCNFSADLDSLIVCMTLWSTGRRLRHYGKNFRSLSKNYERFFFKQVAEFNRQVKVSFWLELLKISILKEVGSNFYWFRRQKYLILFWTQFWDYGHSEVTRRKYVQRFWILSLRLCVIYFSPKRASYASTFTRWSFHRKSSNVRRKFGSDISWIKKKSSNCRSIIS